MKCMSCQEQISAKFKHSITVNQCPYCGKAVTDENLNVLLSHLSEIISQFDNYKEELQEWMFDNLQMVPFDQVMESRSERRKPKRQARVVDYDEEEEEREDIEENEEEDEEVGERSRAFARNAGVDLSRQRQYRDVYRRHANPEAMLPTREQVEADDPVRSFQDMDREEADEARQADRMARTNARMARRLRGEKSGEAPQSVEDVNARYTEFQQRALQTISSGQIKKNSFTRA